MAAGDTNTTIITRLAQEFNVRGTKDSIRRFRQRHGVQIPGTSKAYTHINGDEATGQTEPKGFVRDMYEGPVLDDPDRMLEDRGLDPAEWYIDAITVNEWDGPQTEGNIVRYYQAKFTAKRIKPVANLLPARADGWVKPKLQRIPVYGHPKLIVVMGDQQAPFHDLDLHEKFLQWMDYNRPDRGINLGDKMDLPDISRHPDDPDNVAVTNECIQVAYNNDRDIADASPETEWEWLPGNHDARLRDYVIQKARPLHGLKRADTVDGYGDVVHDVSFLTRCDELGIKYHDSHGPYDLAQVNLGSKLAVRHGWIVRQKGGESAYQSLQKCGYSILVGHTHRQAIVQHTMKEIDGTPRQLLAAEIGCMCRLDPGPAYDNRIFPSYTPMPDWQQGWAVVRLWDNNKFHVSLATYVNNELLWEDQSY